MTLRDYLRVARKRWRIVLAGLLAGLAAAAAITWSSPREYSAQVTIYISAQTDADGAAAAYQGSLLSEQKVKSYTQLLSSNRIAQDVVDQLRLNLPAAQVAGMIKAAAQPDTVLLTASVTDTSPQRAKEIADATGGAFTRLVTQLEQPTDDRPATVTARVVEPATLPVTPVSPRPAVDLSLGALLGLLAGYGAALLRNMLDTTVKSAEELRRLSGAPNLGTIAHDPDVPKHPLTVQEKPRSPRAEAFRKIRTNLQFIDVDRPRKTIVVTSALPEEGKTTTLCNLAIVLARAGHRTVVVEADLRRPRAMDYLGLEGAVGVTSVLAGRVPLNKALQPWGKAMFDVLGSGPIPPNPSELLASQHMADLLAELRERYDTVLLDAPPLLPVTDAAVLGAACDGALLVVRYGKTTGHQITTAMGALDAVSARLLGTVFTMAPASGSSPYYEYYSPPETGLGVTTPLAAVSVPPVCREGRHVENGHHAGRVAGRLPANTLVPRGTNRHG
ncbi:polysaccharide biosynthesis tyrosine autokinase [Amycolatopsis alkalitolerans]|uniref:non-specific protein-tyrosine kinase n=1 Tax=Amycolatopsis alkalitolerans TaxID=2547244 RepID=A0A5C4LV45_9PSEU|nr:polysaccharide biosynthesis tyrosine autokinase [Amycolatopsis alkalitolerans]TNC21883.1 polysaccharide biosynthesis tyrosine autokinase [Amycolatopsis alkalitolerans]